MPVDQVYRMLSGKEIGDPPMLTPILVLAALTSMLLTGRMAGNRHRSVKAWVWASALIGPFAPLILCLLGNHTEAKA